MKKSLLFWQILGFIFTGLVGVALHFLFGWTNQSAVVAPFSAVNESIWEHMKILFFPMLVFAVIENLYIGKFYKSFWCVKLIGIVLSVLLIPVLYYTVNGAFGKTADFVNIVIFYVTAAICFIAETFLLNKTAINCKSPKKAQIVLGLITVAFVVFTFLPPKIPLFKDPVTNTYGYYQST